MEEIQRVKGSRAAYRSHVTRTIKKAKEILVTEGDLADSQVAKLTSIMEQLTQKSGVLKQLNAQVLEAIQSPDDLEAEILEAEEIQDTIHEYVTVIKRRIEPRRTTIEASHSLSATAPAFVPTLSPVTPAAREPVSRLPKLTLPVFQETP